MPVRDTVDRQPYNFKKIFSSAIYARTERDETIFCVFWVNIVLIKCKRTYVRKKSYWSLPLEFSQVSLALYSLVLYYSRYEEVIFFFSSLDYEKKSFYNINPIFYVVIFFRISSSVLFLPAYYSTRIL